MCIIQIQSGFSSCVPSVGSITSRCWGKEPALLPRRHADTRERRKSSLFLLGRLPRPHIIWEQGKYLHYFPTPLSTNIKSETIYYFFYFYLGGESQGRENSLLSVMFVDFQKLLFKIVWFGLKSTINFDDFGLNSGMFFKKKSNVV